MGFSAKLGKKMSKTIVSNIKMDYWTSVGASTRKREATTSIINSCEPVLTVFSFSFCLYSVVRVWKIYPHPTLSVSKVPAFPHEVPLFQNQQVGDFMRRVFADL